MKSFFSFILLLLPVYLFSQARTLTIDEATNMNPRLNPAELSQLQWMGKSSGFTYTARKCLIKGSVESAIPDTLLTLNDLNIALQDFIHEPLKKFPTVTFITESQFFFNSGNVYFNFDLVTRSARLLNRFDNDGKNNDMDTATYKIAYTKANNLFIAYRDREIAVTNEDDPDISYGSERVHRNEFGIGKGTFWSPKGNFLAFYRMDETKVSGYPLIDISQRIAVVTPAKYPMAGMTSHQVTVGVYDIAHGTTIYLGTGGASDQYLTNISWSPDEKFIYMAVLNRDQNHMWLNKYDVQTGNMVKTLFEEKSDCYVEPQNPLRFLHNDPDRFIWQSQRDGYNHLYLYSSDGKLIRQLTQGSWVVTEFLRTDDMNTFAYFMGNKDNPLNQMLYGVNLKNGEIQSLTRVPGTHTVAVKADGKFFLDKYSSVTVANQVELLGEKGQTLKVLLANENPLKEIALGSTSIFTLKGESGTDLYARLIKPVNFDSTKKYPVIIYVYGGPHSQLITNSWLGGAGLFLNYLADQGYVVFTLDNRGTANRGAAFEQAIFRNLGVAEMADQMTGVNYLKSLPFVDSTRIGINGWSYGGFMAISLMLKNPGVFKVVVCGGPVIDWKYYEVMYGERYMDTPEENPQGYSNACLLNHVKNLTGKLLIIHDYQDETVVPQNSLVFLKKCVEEGKQVDYFIYPGHEHNVRGKDRVHLNQKMCQYFKDFL